MALFALNCGELNKAYRLEPKESKKGKHVRKGIWKCGGCREQFTVTVGTIFADSPSLLFERV